MSARNNNDNILEAFIRYNYLNQLSNLSSEMSMELMDLRKYLNIDNSELESKIDFEDLVIDKVHAAEHNTIDFTLPGYNYLGPGTKILHKLMKNIQPVDHLDQNAYEHDWDYFSAKDSDDINRTDESFSSTSLYDGNLGKLSAFIMKLKNKLTNPSNSLENFTDLEKQIIMTYKLNLET